LAASFTLGNTAISRSQVDARSNFTVVDTNSPASTSGQIISFAYYANNTNPFRFVIVDSSNAVKYVSPQITPASTGAKTYTPSSPVNVLAGDKLGVHFALTGTIPFDGSGANASWTSSGSGVPATGATLSYAGSGSRTYSIAAYGNETSQPTSPIESADIPGFAYGKIDYTAGGLNRMVLFFADSRRDTRPYTGNGTLIYRDANNDWYRVDVRYVAVNGSDAYFAGRVVDASQPSWVNQWLYAKVHDGGSSGDQIWGQLMRGADAIRHFTLRNNLTNPSSGSFNVSSGDLMVVSQLDFVE